MAIHAAAADRADIRRELGDLDDLTVGRILALGPSVAEVVEASVRLAQGDDPDVVRGPPSLLVQRIVREVRDALERAEEDEMLPPDEV